MPHPNLKARTALAAEIARLHRQRFNEAVAEGFYPCAPATVRGSARVFDINDIVTLWVYGQLLDEGVVPRSAGHVACALRKLLEQHPELDRAAHVRATSRPQLWMRSEDLDPSATHLGSADIVSVREWRLGATRDRVIRDLQAEAQIVGDDDGEE